MEYAKFSDVVVLASGDGDFDVLVEVYGVSKLTAKSLSDSASTFVPMKDDLLLKPTT